MDFKPSFDETKVTDPDIMAGFHIALHLYDGSAEGMVYFAFNFETQSFHHLYLGPQLGQVYRNLNCQGRTSFRTGRDTYCNGF